MFNLVSVHLISFRVVVAYWVTSTEKDVIVVDGCQICRIRCGDIFYVCEIDVT